MPPQFYTSCRIFGASVIKIYLDIYKSTTSNKEWSEYKRDINIYNIRSISLGPVLLPA
jgi:hypothetical protein